YMFSLVALLLSFTDSDRRFSLSKSSERTVPLWQYHILRLQVFIVYFYGGLAKLNPDWLICAEPIRSFVSYVFPEMVESDVFVSFFKYGGLLFDLLIGFLLFIKPTRMIALIFVAFFNFSNAYIFDDIGIFPFIMFFATIIFFSEDDIVVQKIKGVLGMKPGIPQATQSSLPAFPKVLILFFCFQLLFPLRYILLPHDKDWTGIGQRFAWRMKIQSRPVEQYEIYVTSPQIPGESQVQINTFINTMQMTVMSQDPVALWQFANYVKQEALKQGIPEPEVHARIRVSMNGSPEQYIVDPSVDLSMQDYDPLGYNEWIPERIGNCLDQ
ncbi:MAG: HTTM domain-containing protein, partial [Flavobacteriales bacterium]|nr:HTTM domain-containing protein [Flavobacteriales bacterium]